VNRTQLHVDQRIFKVGYTAAVEKITEPVPWVLRGGVHRTPIEKDVALVRVQIEGETLVKHIVGAAEVFKAGERIAKGENDTRTAAQAEAIAQSLLAELA